ncbi:MAG: hypothetical protein GY953_37195, partial [bacterium]|nr:hypothetical protein [bacterium]
RSIDALAIARIAKDAGMRAILLKNHYAPTAGLAYLVERAVPGIEVYGGIALNSTTGLNAQAVQHMARTTGRLGKVVWLPTFDSEHYHRTSRPNPNHISVSSNGRLVPELLAVLDTIAQDDLTLATGHSSPSESLAIIREARRRGIERIIVTHPLPPPISMTIEQQKEAAQLGAFLEYPFGTTLSRFPGWRASEEERMNLYVEAIRAVGPEHVVLSSDLGQPMNPIHTDGLVAFIGQLRAKGFSPNEINLMTRRNPARVLGIEQETHKP